MATTSTVATPVTLTTAWQALKEQTKGVEGLHLRDLIMDAKRCEELLVEYDGITFDYSRQRVTSETMKHLFQLAEQVKLEDKIQKMFQGEKINVTENRAVLHVALRASPDEIYKVDGTNVVRNVHEVLDRIKGFSKVIRDGSWKGATGKNLTDVVAIGIGGSYLGPEFVYEALRMDPTAKAAARGRKLRFLANVDPVDVARAQEGLNPETTLVVVVSKTFTTAETMLNARTMRQWISKALGEEAVSKHMVAVSTNLKAVKEFGIHTENAFGFWDWVGGRYSVSSAVGVLPLSLQYSYDIVEQFLAGARDMDKHFSTVPLRKNIPVVMGLLGVWNSTFLGYSTRALLPYQQALLKLAPHIQQVDMESNGKRVHLDGSPLEFGAGPINFGEPGTNGQHSFYQLVHQGRVVPADFVAVKESQNPIDMESEKVSNHDELMSNFFAQPDALAAGKSAEQCKMEGIPEELVPHKTFPGNRPSSSLLLPKLDAFTTGQLLAIFEHRTAVEGFIWGINSFDQWGVELGKVLAKNVRSQLNKSRKEGAAVSGFNPSTTRLLQKYLS